jgi:hypothetical protein
MGLNNAQLAVIDHRRRQVARMRLRGMTQREIVDGLIKLKIVNPDTKQPYSLGTINADLQALDREWLKQAQGETVEYKARTLAELREVKRQGWSDKDMGIVLRALKQETELLGLDAPVQYQEVPLEQLPELNDVELESLYNKLFPRRRG